MSGCSLIGTKVLLRWRVLFTAALHQNDTSGLQTSLNRRRRQKWESEFRLQIGTLEGRAAFYVCMNIGMMHLLQAYAMGNISPELLGDCGKVTVICLGTHQCLLRQWGLMTVQQRGGERLNLSQSTSEDMTVDLQLSSPFAE